MHGKHGRKASRFLVVRGILIVVLTVILGVSSFVTVMANTVSANVIDGDKSYTFSMNSNSLSEILSQAQDAGLVPLGPLDVAEQVENTTTVNIRRGVSVTVLQSDKSIHLVAYRGDTVLKTLEDNNIIVKDSDEILPARDALVEAGLTIELRRSCQITIVADGKKQRLVLAGGTVADALQEAGVALGDRDIVNFAKDEPLFESMVIRVSRPARITVSVDGTVNTYDVSAMSVQSALQMCGVTLSDEDRINVSRTSPLRDGMEIVINRVTTEEERETEVMEYPTQYVTSDELYEDEYVVRTPGEDGEKEVVYKLIYVDGELEGKEVVSEEILREPVAEIVARGTKERTISGLHASYGGGTFVDMYGNEVSYSRMLVGECTAAWIPGGTTSIGLVSERGIIAVDPKLIPYGTRMYVVSPDGSIVYGYGLAGDTGGACMAGRIIADLYYDTLEECSIIGRRDMVVYLLD